MADMNSSHVRHTERSRKGEADGWREVAEALADRMANHAYACAPGHNAFGEEDAACGPVHQPPDAWARECPFCADTAAYELYLKRAQK
jgi:hypothetical protein